MNYDYELELVRKKINKGERMSKRDFFETREIKIENNPIENADGSAIVTLGKTKVIAGVKASIEEPFPDSPDEGTLSVNVEMSPIADPDFDAGPPTDKSIELSRVVDRGIRESKGIDFKDLCIVEGEKVWTLFLDIYVLNNDGNLFDACSIAALAALRNTYLPKIDEQFKIIKGEKDRKLKLNFHPLLFTFAKIDDKIILDPDLYEDNVADARFSVAITEEGKITAMQKGIGGSFTIEELENMIAIAKKDYKKRIKYIE